MRRSIKGTMAPGVSRSFWYDRDARGSIRARICVRNGGRRSADSKLASWLPKWVNISRRLSHVSPSDHTATSARLRRKSLEPTCVSTSRSSYNRVRLCSGFDWFLRYQDWNRQIYCFILILMLHEIFHFFYHTFLNLKILWQPMQLQVFFLQKVI